MDRTHGCRHARRAAPPSNLLGWRQKEHLMRRPTSRYLPHSYALMAVGAALTVFIVVQLVQYAQATYAAWPVFVAGLVTAAYVGLVVGILLYVPRKRL